MRGTDPRDPLSPYHRWKPRALNHCDCCRAPVVWLYDIPDGFDEVDCLCRDCALAAIGVARDESDQAELLRHNAEFDRWESLTDRERDDEIRRAMG